MKPIKLIGFILRASIGGLAIAFLVIYLWPSLSERIGRSTHPDASAVKAPTTPFSYAEAVNRAAPAVVSIHTRTTKSQPIQIPNSGRSRTGTLYGTIRDQGSGVLLSEEGYILTNHHVIKGVQNITIELWDGRVTPATVVGTDPETDLAVLKIELADLPVAPISNQAEVRVGDVVLAIGNALGLSHTVTMGIVSATGRKGLDSQIYDDFIQTDAAINVGNSGGALVNAVGELIGINTLVDGRRSAENIGFAIPMTLARTVMQEIIVYGSVVRGWLGATFTDVRPMAQPDGTWAKRGIGVREVYRGGPAWNAGLRQGDIIVSMGGAAVQDINRFLLQIAESEPGTVVELEVYRQPETFSTYATLIQQPPLP